MGTFLYCVISIDSTILVILNKIGSEQSTSTTNTESKCAKLMDYLHTHPNAVVRFHAIDMILYIKSDAYYLFLPKARSCFASIFYLSNSTTKRLPLNGTIQVICKTLQNIVSSAAEAETGGIFVGGQQTVLIMTALSEIQPPTTSQRNPHIDLQLYRERRPQRQPPPEALKSLQHAILVDKRQNQAAPIQTGKGTK